MTDHECLLADTAEALASIGVAVLCHPSSHELAPYFPHCDDMLARLAANDGRYLAEEQVMLGDGADADWFYLKNGLCALGCVVVAAFAAGLTMGLMSLDPLMLHIKKRAGPTEKERQQAAALMPVVKQHHLLLVTLLLLNSIANEALPLFLDKIVPSYLAIIFSVTLVLFFGEIIPSAVFTGPNQVEIAAKLIPLVKLAIALLFPLAYPIAKILDCLLHDEDSSSNVFNRNELTALVRIQYEEHLANKRRHRIQRTHVAGHSTSNRGCDNVSIQDAKLDAQISMAHSSIGGDASTATETSAAPSSYQRSPSIHFDEVSMIAGALSMKTKVASDVYTPLRKLFAIPSDTVLDEQTVVSIYSSGYSRIPVYDRNPKREKDFTAIRGVLMTKQLIVIDSSDERPLSTFPLYTPACVSPKMNLVDLINMFQTGQGSHMALVCARPHLAAAALARGEALPADAGLMGVITLEDVLEQLLQEQILDESDKLERGEQRLAKLVWGRWTLFVKKKKVEREEALLQHDPMLLDVVKRATEGLQSRSSATALSDSSPLLQGAEQTQSKRGEAIASSLFHFFNKSATTS